MKFRALTSLSYPALASLLETYLRAPARPYTFNPRSATYQVGEYTFSNVPEIAHVKANGPGPTS